MDKRLLTIKELSDMLSIKVRTLYRLTEWGKIPFIKIGRLVRYDVRDINEFLKKNRCFKAKHQL